MKRKTWTRLLLMLIALSLALCGTVIALMFHRTDPIENKLDPAEVDCLVHEVLSDTGTYTAGTHYTQDKSSIRVENTGNISAYIRLRFVSYWVDVNGNIVGKASEMPEIPYDETKWIQSGDTYYYKYPVASGDFTAELLKTGQKIVLRSEDGCNQVLEVFADAIQSVPANAAVGSWNVSITGTEIVSVP